MTAMSDPVRFVLLFDGRTGSIHVTELLNSHPDIRMEGEILGPLLRRGRTARDQLERVAELYTSSGDELAAIGFKTKLRDVLDPEGFGRLLRANSVRVIRMYRQNEIKGAISSILGGEINQRTGKWNITATVQLVPRQEVSLVALQRLVSRRAAHELVIQQLADDLGLPTVELSYEDLLTDEDQALRRLLAFLDVPWQHLHSDLVKATSDDLTEVVANLEDLRAAYQGTRFEAMFDEQLVPSWSHPTKGEAEERWARTRGALSRVRVSAGGAAVSPDSCPPSANGEPAQRHRAPQESACRWTRPWGSELRSGLPWMVKVAGGIGQHQQARIEIDHPIAVCDQSTTTGNARAAGGGCSTHASRPVG